MTLRPGKSLVQEVLECDGLDYIEGCGMSDEQYIETIQRIIDNLNERIATVRANPKPPQREGGGA